VQNLVGIESAVTDMRMREKNTFCVDFFYHTRTVDRECCKGDDETLWERGKFDPPPPKTPSTDGYQNLCRYYSVTTSVIATPCKILSKSV